MKKPDIVLAVTPRASDIVSLRIPADVVEALRAEATHRDMSVEALLKLYIGAGLRQDISKRYADRLLEATARVLSQHLTSPSEVTEIIREIRGQTVPHVS